MSSELFLGIDQGSSSTKAVLLGSGGEVMREFQVAVPEPEYLDRSVEQDGEALLSSVVDLFLQAKAWAHEEGHAIRAAGLACQRSGVLAWRSLDGIPVHKMITWADTRTYPVIQNFGLGTERISVKTGIPTIAHFAAGKIALLQREFLEPSVHIGTLDSFLVYRLSGRRVFATEDTMASRTMLYALAGRDWDAGLCHEFKVDVKRLPRIHPSLAPHTTFEGIPVLAMVGDQQAALIGRLNETRRPLLNLGTIASIMIDTGVDSKPMPGLISTVFLSRLIPGGFSREFRFLSEITSPVTGSVLLEPCKRKWAKDAVDLNALCVNSYKEFPQGRATAYFVHRRSALPHWPDGVGNVMVAKPEATDSDRARAVVENVGNLVLRMFDELIEKGLLRTTAVPIEFDVAGGGSELDYLLQYLADCSGFTFHRLANRNAGARGAALSAWMSSTGVFEAYALNREEPDETYVCENSDRRKRYLMWQRLERDVLAKTLPSHAVIEE
jgi:glycerol kinase